MSTVRLHYWAGARAAARTEAETWPAASIAAALTAACESRRDPEFDRVVGICTFLVDGRSVYGTALTEPLEAAVEVHVLPPFAGGSGGKCRFEHVSAQ